MSDEEIEAPGWDALETALRGIHADVEPVHWAPTLAESLGGGAPLDRVSAYRTNFGGVPHWHFVTYGFSELYERSGDDKTASGWGFELTFRVVDTGTEPHPPGWAVLMMQNLARYLWESGSSVEVGHSLTLNGPHVRWPEPQFGAVLFVADPQLPPLETPNGRVAFIQLMGLTHDELGALLQWDAAKFTELLKTKTAAWMTDLQRESFLEDPAFASVVREGAVRDGSTLFVTKAKVEDGGDRYVLTLGENELDGVQRLLKDRVRFDRPARLWSREGGVIDLSGGGGTLYWERVWEFTLPDEDQDAVLALQPRQGEYRLPSDRVIVRVVPGEG
ncbi:suppressor of fused domain protein [Myxococcus qinghaiensis]|uniref:suppressor of fused domain protein n=1 Tax=Myxococcus qinghaiensis TaxID=2906758 RepID=UPI0020A7D687|nr:suppressor of fused domain protein [Myxococcus qinghaiensis]MCP3170106.1 suppressor of fused domain protein [Myxococcus qinghaiensis]